MNSLKRKKIMVIGVGNMGEALIRGMLRLTKISRVNLIGLDIDAKKLDSKARKFGFRKANGFSDIKKADVIILAVKPQNMEELMSNIRGYLSEKKLLISVVAGITTRWIEKKVGKKIPVIRSMLNTPALIGEGMIVVARGTYAQRNHEFLAESLLSCSGKVISLAEKHMNSVTAVSGSGPAYVFYLAEAMIEAGISLGLDRRTSTVLTQQTLVGASRLLLCSKDSPEVLRKKVTSPGGTTEAALKWLEENLVKVNLIKAIHRAKTRGDELIKK